MEKELIAIYDKDSRKYHRFLIAENQGVTGSIYVSKATAVPDTIIVTLKTKAGTDKEKEARGADKKGEKGK